MSPVIRRAHLKVGPANSYTFPLFTDMRVHGRNTSAPAMAVAFCFAKQGGIQVRPRHGRRVRTVSSVFNIYMESIRSSWASFLVPEVLLATSFQCLISSVRQLTLTSLNTIANNWCQHKGKHRLPF